MFVFLTAGALLLTKDGVTTSFLLNLLFYIITPVISLTMTRIMFQSENAMIVADALRRIDSVLAFQPLPEPQQLAYPKDSSVEVEDVTFSYDGQKDALQHISLSIRPGQTVAFVGPSGGGKTTVSRLAVRFWDASRGRITVGGMDVSTADPEALLELYAIVFQDVTLFDNTILENIRIGRKDATDEQVLAAAKLANFDEFAARLPDGWNSRIGENGCALSGGLYARMEALQAESQRWALG